MQIPGYTQILNDSAESTRKCVRRYPLSELAKLATLVVIAAAEEQIDEVGLQFGMHGPYGSEFYDVYVEDWVAHTILLQRSGVPPPKRCFGERANSLGEACESLLTKLHNRGFQSREVRSENIIPESEQTEKLIARLQSLLLDLDKGWSLTITYIPNLSPEEWEASVTTSKWGRGTIARKEGSSLYQACAELWEMLQEMKDELPKMV